MPNETTALPWPDAGEEIDIHGVEVVADHVQSRVVLTSIVPLPPEDGADDIELVAVTWHFAPVGAVTSIDEDPHAAIEREKPRREASRIAERLCIAVRARSMQ